MRIQKTLNHGNTRWRVSISLHGKRRQRFFTSRDEARAWLNSIEADSTGFWSNRTPEEQRDIVSAFNLASKRGVSIYQCILNSPSQLTPFPYPMLLEGMPRSSNSDHYALHLSSKSNYTSHSWPDSSPIRCATRFHQANWKSGSTPETGSDPPLMECLPRLGHSSVGASGKATPRTTRARP